MSSLRAKAINSGFWSFFETFANKGLQFVVSIILARLLMPEDFGIVGVLAIFIGIAGVLVDSGFKTSIIRTKNITDAEGDKFKFNNHKNETIIKKNLYIYILKNKRTT